jgi:hypothetical protein
MVKAERKAKYSITSVCKWKLSISIGWIDGFTRASLGTVVSEPQLHAYPQYHEAQNLE